MFLYRVKVEELDASRLLTLKDDLARCETGFRAKCPIREMSVVREDANELDIYLALDDVIEPTQLKTLVGEINALLAAEPARPRVSSELIHI
jgi:hypothetical protein